MDLHGGRNESGRRVASGVYVAVARMATPEGTTLLRKKIMVVH